MKVKIYIIAIIAGLISIVGFAAETAVNLQKSDGYVKPVIQIFPLAKVSGSNILLAEIASLNNINPENKECFSEISFGNSPLAGNQRILLKSNIMFTLEQNGITPDAFEIICPPKTIIKRSSTRIDREVILEQIKRQITSGSPYPPENLLIDLKSLSPDLYIPEGKTDYNIKVSQTSKFFGSIPVQIEVVVNNAVVKKFSCNVDIDMNVSAPRAVKPIARGAVVNPEDYEIVQTRFSLLPNKTVADSESLSDVVANKNIIPGEYFTLTSVTKPYIVKSGEPVIVKAVTGNMVVTAKGVAVQRGRKGDLIKIVNPISNKNFMALVEDTGIVKVIF